MTEIQLTSQQLQTLRDALLAAFPSFSSLEQLLLFGLDENLQTIAGTGNLNDSVVNLLKWAKAKGRLRDLITEASKANSGNPKLKAWVQEHLVTSASTSPTETNPPSNSGGTDNSTSATPSANTATNTPAQSHPKVFISYSHDSPEHDKKVWDLSEKLRSEGVVCMIDQYITTPPEGWQRWMMNQVEQSAFVVVIATEAYNRQFRGLVDRTQDFEAQWEGTIITQELYNANGQNLKFVPVVLQASDTAHIPLLLQSATYYNVADDSNYDNLYYYLTHQPPYVPPIGQIRQRPPRNP